MPMNAISSYDAVRAANAGDIDRAESLEREITVLASHIYAGTYRLLSLVRELDGCAPWGAWGLNSCAHWLNWKCGIGLNAAREKVRVAHALADLPRISAAFARGELSYAKVRAMTRVATPANEDYLLMIAGHGTAAHVERAVRAYRGVQRSEERERAGEQYAEREMHYARDEDGTVVMTARLPAAEGAVVMKALEAGVDALRAEARGEARTQAVQDGAGEVPAGELSTGSVTAVTPAPPEAAAPTLGQQRADALVLMARSALQSGLAVDSAAERYQVVVHVGAKVLAGGEDGRCEVDSGARVHPETARRIACDASIVRLTEDGGGNPLDIGRKTRAISPAMRRALDARDGGCRFPGCTRRRFIDAHHITHWANGGETRLDNLVTLCRHHHGLVHEGGFGVEVDGAGTVVFTRPDGRCLERAPALHATTGDALAECNAALGLRMDDQPCVPAWDGLDMDLAMAVDGLLSRDGALDWHGPVSRGSRGPAD